MTKRIRYFPLLFFFIGILMSAAAVSWAETCKLELKKLDNLSLISMDSSNSNFIFLRTSGQYAYLEREGGPSFPNQEKFSSLVKKDREDYKSKFPFKGVFTLGKEKYIFAADSDDLYAKGYNRLYFDRNHNFDLTDDTVLEAKAPPEGVNYGEGSSQIEFPLQDLTLEIDGTQFVYSFLLSVYSNLQSQTDPPNYARAGVYPAVFREGDIELNGKKHHLTLLDFNSNGRFDDVYEVVDKDLPDNARISAKFGDNLFVDPDMNDKTMSYYLTDRKDCFPVSKLILIDGQFYTLALTPFGDQATLTPSDCSTGLGKNPNKRYSAVFYGDQGLVKVIGEANKELTMPEGSWKLLDYTIDATEGEPTGGQRRPNSTQVSASGTKQSPVFAVKKGETVELPFGPPFKPLVEIQPLGGRNQDAKKVVSLNLLLQGKGNEICRSLNVNGQNPDSPSFVIATKTNEIVERGTFEYG